MKNLIKVDENFKIQSTATVMDALVKFYPDFIESSLTPDSSHLYFHKGVLISKPDGVPLCHVYNAQEKLWFDPRSENERVEQESGKARTERTRLLTLSDWTQLPDAPRATKEVWAIYRQALRDITEQPGFPFEIVWPVSP